MEKHQVLINAFMAILQVLVIGLTLFVLYRFILETLGAVNLGIWSLVIATTSVTQIANLGFSGSTVKFVAKYAALNQKETVSKIIQTAFISISIIAGGIILIGFPIAKMILKIIIKNDSLFLALSILPYAFTALWLSIIAGIFLSSLDGIQRIEVRSLILMSGAVIHLVMCILLIRPYGLFGLAYANLIRSFLILIASLFFLKRLIPFLPFPFFRWEKHLFREMISYSLNFQAISLTIMFYDPITKALLSMFGGLSMVGFYEMANRMILQLRQVIVSANQVLVPAFAGLKEKTPEKINLVYLSSYRLLFFIAIPVYSLIIIYITYISKLWIGHIDNTFILFSILLSIGWLFNTINVPAYFAYLGIGDLSWNVRSHIYIGILNIVLGYLLGIFLGGVGVVIGWTVSLSVGSSLIYLSFHSRNKIPLIELLPKTNIALTLACLTGIIFALMIQAKLINPPFSSMIYALILMIISISVWRNPIRAQYIELIRKEFFRKK